MQKIVENKSFQEGRKKHKEGKIKDDPIMPIIWVKKRVSNKEWNTYFSNVPNYCFLSKDAGGVLIGYNIINEGYIPDELEILNDFELQKVREYLTALNYFPIP